MRFNPADELEQEAIKNAKETKYHGIITNVLTPEYLIAIMLRAGRPKDIEKIKKMIAQTTIKEELLVSILKKYNLYDKYQSIIGEKYE